MIQMNFSDLIDYRSLSLERENASLDMNRLPSNLSMAFPMLN